MNVIASDSFPLQPKMVDTIVSTAGERYDFILDANQPIGMLIIDYIFFTFLWASLLYEKN